MTKNVIPLATLGLVAGFFVGLILGSNTRAGAGKAVSVETKGADLVVTLDGGKLAASAIGL